MHRLSEIYRPYRQPKELREYGFPRSPPMSVTHMSYGWPEMNTSIACDPRFQRPLISGASCEIHNMPMCTCGTVPICNKFRADGTTRRDASIKTKNSGFSHTPVKSYITQNEGYYNYRSKVGPRHTTHIYCKPPEVFTRSIPRPGMGPCIWHKPPFGITQYQDDFRWIKTLRKWRTPVPDFG